MCMCSEWVCGCTGLCFYPAYVFYVCLLYACGHKHVSGTQKLKVWWSPPAAAAAAVTVTHASLPDHDASGLNRVVSDGTEWRMERDNLSQTYTGCSVELYSRGLVKRGCHSLSNPGFSLSFSLPPQMKCFVSISHVVAGKVGFKWLSKRIDRNRKIHRDVLYPWRRIHYRHNYVKKKKGRSSAQCSTKQAFKWEMTVVSTEVPETAQPILMRMKHFFDHYLRGKKTFSPF